MSRTAVDEFGELSVANELRCDVSSAVNRAVGVASPGSHQSCCWSPSTSVHQMWQHELEPHVGACSVCLLLKHKR